MILKTAYYDTAAFSAFTRENAFIDPIISHTFNEPARCILRIADPDGSLVDKYDSDAAGDAIYVGSGRVKLYESDGTLLFDGRIMKSDRAGNITMLTCLDWLSQLDDERVHYDFREDLDSDNGAGLQGLRESTLTMDLAGAVPLAGPGYDAGGGVYYVWDYGKDFGHAASEFDGMYMVLAGSMAGDISVEVSPYDKTATGEGANAIDTDDDDCKALWFDDSDYDETADDDENFNITYTLKPIVGHDTPTDFYTHGSISGARIKAVLSWDGAGADTCTMAVASGPAKILDEFTVTDDLIRRSYELPGSYLSNLVDATGKAYIYFDCNWDGAGEASLKVYYLTLEVDVTTTGYSTAISITDTVQVDQLQTAVDLSTGTPATCVWHGLPYCIVQPIYTHINGIVTAGDPLVTLTTSVETTTGITTRHLSDRTRLEILQNVSPIDAAVFWLPLASTQMKWKKTVDAASSDLRDHQVLRWKRVGYDFKDFRNHAIVYGIDDLSYEYDDATAQADYDVKRTEIIKGTGVTSEYDAKQLATSIINRDKTINLLIEADLAGLSDIRLGDWLSVTSSLLGLTDADYIVYHWSYQNNITTIRLQPKSTVGYQIYRQTAEEFMMTPREISKQKIDTYVPNLSTETW